MDFSRQLILVNKSHPIDDEYTPDLCDIRYSDKKADKIIIHDLNNMLEDARRMRYEIYVCSAYRSVEYQRKLFDNKVERLVSEGFDIPAAIERASIEVMPPRYSEHHTGLAVDIVSENNSELEISQEDTDENKWLMENAHKYGFVLRYPKGKEDITGVTYEPWHFRYVGVYIAEYMYTKNYTLEEFLLETLL